MKIMITLKEKLKLKNEVNIRGTIIGIKASGKFTSFVIVSDGNSEIKGSTVINVSFYRNVVGDFKIKDHVDVIAHMQSKIIYSKGKKSYHQLVVGDSIKHTNRLLYHYIPCKEFKTSEGGIPDDINKAFIFGEVSRVYTPNDGYAIITVNVPSAENKENYCDIVCYQRQAKTAMLINIGDYIVSVGEIRSAKERPVKGEIFKQYIVCKDITRVDKEDFDI